MCTGVELLFLSRCSGLLSLRSFTGCPQRKEPGGSLCCTWFFLYIWQSLWTICLRLALSLRLYSGYALQDKNAEAEITLTIDDFDYNNKHYSKDDLVIIDLEDLYKKIELGPSQDQNGNDIAFADRMKNAKNDLFNKMKNGDEFAKKI